MNELSGKRSQAKGRAGELELCRLLQEYGYPVQPGEAVSFGSTPDLTGLDGVHIECKRGEKQALYEWIEQAQRDSGKFKDGLPALLKTPLPVAAPRLPRRGKKPQPLNASGTAITRPPSMLKNLHP